MPTPRQKVIHNIPCIFLLLVAGLECMSIIIDIYVVINAFLSQYRSLLVPLIWHQFIISTAVLITVSVLLRVITIMLQYNV